MDFQGGVEGASQFFEKPESGVGLADFQAGNNRLFGADFLGKLGLSDSFHLPGIDESVDEFELGLELVVFDS